MKLLMCLKNYCVITALKNILTVFYHHFLADEVKKFDQYLQNKNAKYLFYRFNEFNDYIKAYGSNNNNNNKKKIKHTQKIKNSVGLQKIEETNNF